MAAAGAGERKRYQSQEIPEEILVRKLAKKDRNKDMDSVEPAAVVPAQPVVTAAESEKLLPSPPSPTGVCLGVPEQRLYFSHQCHHPHHCFLPVRSWHNFQNLPVFILNFVHAISHYPASCDAHEPPVLVVEGCHGGPFMTRYSDMRSMCSRISIRGRK
jgi:hypothetical protein